ncbi:hypothetical protein DFH07DRAFT_1056340 [Mycena maculata]|uniref:Zn(2)-C6 fungal-type domain-containing protein n=1 Tax=Mycena maculata TaxID=230809 RepID=A0AAD7K6A2_9AGAR|nr:hypothetical protein DFH07DRAFT_1056340 [Mycena maculata]
MRLPHVPLSHPQWPRDGWSPAPTFGSGSAYANGVRLRLFDDAPGANRPHATSDRLPFHRQPISTSSVPDWTPSSRKLFSPAPQSYQELPAELEPLWRHTEQPRISSSVPSLADDDFEEDSIDISALEYQYLDLSEHCPMPSSPSDSTLASEFAENTEAPPTKRRRIAEWHSPCLPHAQTLDEDFNDTNAPREERRIGLSPFHHSTAPPNRSHAPHNLHPQAPPAAQALKFRGSPCDDGRSRRQALACLFCRRRKIACGRPPGASADQACSQCVKRGRGHQCEYPTESRRGQHSRIKSMARRQDFPAITMTRSELSPHSPRVVRKAFRAQANSAGLSFRAAIVATKAKEAEAGKVERPAGIVRRNPGRMDGVQWNGDSFVCARQVDGDVSRRHDGSWDAEEHVNELRDGGPCDDRVVVSLMDIARPAKRRGVAKKFEVLPTIRRVIEVDDDAQSEQWEEWEAESDAWEMMSEQWESQSEAFGDYGAEEQEELYGEKIELDRRSYSAAVLGNAQ